MAGEDAAAAQAAEPEAPETPATESAEAEPETAAQAETEGSAEADEPGAADEPAEPDWKARSRHWEGRAKASKAKADEKDAEIARLTAQLARHDAVAEVAREKGVDAGLLARMAGDTAEEIAANADALVEWARSAQKFPEVVDSGAGRPAAVTREQIMAEKNPVKRAQLMGAHKNLFVK